MLVGDVEPAAPRVAVMPMDGDAEGAAFALAESLRGAGIAVDLPAGGAIGKRLKKADRAGVRIAVILGSDEVAGGSAQIRDLGAGTQQEVPQAEVASVLNGMLGEGQAS